MTDFTKIAAAAAQTQDMTVAQKGGGGDYVPPAAGPCRLRLIGYVETGSHMAKGFAGAPDKVKPEASLFFEVSGPKHPPVVGSDGVSRPAAVVEIRTNVSLNEKATFWKLFNKLNYAGKARHIAQLLGDPYKGTIVHRKYKRNDGSEGTAVELKNTEGFTIEAPRVEDPETGDYKALVVAPAITPLRCFLWNHADMAQWESIFIPGEYPARTADDGTVTAPAKSKNYLQEKIRAALNFKGSPIAQLLATQGKGVETGPVEETTANPFEEAPAAEEGDLLSGLG
jgi:hypothetical protein